MVKSKNLSIIILKFNFYSTNLQLKNCGKGDMDSSERSDTLVSGAGGDNQQSERPGNSHVEGAADAENRNGELRTASFGKNEMLKALEVVERDSMAIAQSFTSLFASLRTTLSEVSLSLKFTKILLLACYSSAIHL